MYICKSGTPTQIHTKQKVIVKVSVDVNKYRQLPITRRYVLEYLYISKLVKWDSLTHTHTPTLSLSVSRVESHN